MSEHDFLDVGFETPAMPLVRPAALQAERLKCCGVDAAAHGDAGRETWAPGLLGTDCFIHLGDAGQSIRGSVHTAMLVEQFASVPLAEPLTVQGRTTEVREIARGPEAVMAFTFKDKAGETRFRLVLDVLMPDARRMTGPPAARPSGKPPADPRQGLAMIAERQLQPEHVITYGGAKNPIHLDPEFAQSLGFRAPIAHGVMTAVWLLGALDRPAGNPGTKPKAPTALSASFKFRRPVFWDDAMELWAAPGDGRYVSLNADGKLTAEMAVTRADY